MPRFTESGVKWRQNRSYLGSCQRCPGPRPSRDNRCGTRDSCRLDALRRKHWWSLPRSPPGVGTCEVSPRLRVRLSVTSKGMKYFKNNTYYLKYILTCFLLVSGLYIMLNSSVENEKRRNPFWGNFMINQSLEVCGFQSSKTLSPQMKSIICFRFCSKSWRNRRRSWISDITFNFYFTVPKLYC